MYLVLILFALAGGCARGPSDDTIATQIKAKFFTDPLVKVASLSVAVAKGEVTLTGVAGSVDVELEAFKLAMDTAGVRKIHDQIVVVQPVEAPAPSQPAVQRTTNQSVTAAAPAAPPLDSDYVPSPPPPPEELRAVRPVRPQASPPVLAIVESPSPEAIVTAAAPPAPAEFYRPPVWDNDPPTLEPAKPPSHARVQLAGSGVPAPVALYQKWFADFRASDSKIEINFQTTGPGGGIKPLLERNIDFVLSDTPMTDQDMGRRRILHFPATITGVAIICNLEGSLRELVLSGELLAAIYQGQITRWDHPAIQALNPRMTLPSRDIAVIHRSDASTATQTFTEFLSGVPLPWNRQSGGFAAKGNDGVFALVKQTPFSLGYVEASLAMQNKLPTCALVNRTGRTIKLTPESLSAAARGTQIAPDFRSSLVGSLDKGAYPIASLIWMLVPERQLGRGDKRDALVALLDWILTRGQTLSEPFGFAPLPKEVLAREQSLVGKMKSAY